MAIKRDSPEYMVGYKEGKRTYARQLKTMQEHNSKLTETLSNNKSDLDYMEKGSKYTITLLLILLGISFGVNILQFIF